MKRLMNAATPRMLLMLSLALTVSASPALATWPHDPNNGNVAVCTAAPDQFNPTIVPDGAGGVIVTWHDYRAGATADIYAQRLNAAGVPQWTVNGVPICTAASDQYNPVIVSDGAGGAVITWYDYRSGGTADIYAQRVDAAGVVQWTGNGVALCTNVSHQSDPRVASDGAGGAIVTWYDLRNGSSDIFAQRVNALGTPQWTANGVGICTATGSQSIPAISADGAGGAFFAWFDYRGGATSDVYAQRVNAAGTAQWTINGVALCTAADNQSSFSIVLDGSGGAIVGWYDQRSGNRDIYAQRVNAAGVSQWTGNGVALCTAANDQVGPFMISDGSGGAIATWYDLRSGNYDIYAQRVNAAGTPQWTADGVALCIAAGAQQFPTIVSDGAGGAIVSWQDGRNGITDLYAQRISATGAPQWTGNGVPLCTAVGSQSSPQGAPDGLGGAIIAWSDLRNGNYDIYAQRISSSGDLGNPEPSISSARDVPNDQGGKVKLVWSPSYLDANPENPISNYWVWRSVPPNVAAEALAQGAVLMSDDARVGPSPDRRTLKFTSTSASLYSWEYVGQQVAHALASYSYVVPTTSDSVGASNPLTAFFIEAETSSGVFLGSAPDSGYSVDNLGPVTPAPFTAAYSFGATHLHWGVNREGDLAGYRLYRGSSSSFIPGPGNLVSAQPDTGYGDVGPAGSWYKLSAVDIHGNESVFAILGPNGTLDAPGPSVTAFFFAPPSPNPSSRGTTFRFGLPREGAVTLTLFDQQGRRVREITRGVRPAGEHRLPWDGRDDAGNPVPSGLYFAKLDHAGRSLTVRLLAIH